MKNRDIIAAEELHDLITKGYTTQQLAEHFKCGMFKVKQWRKKYGLSGEAGSKENARKVKDLYEQGLLDPEIAEKLGLTPMGVAHHRRRLGLAGRYKVYQPFPLQGHAYEALIGSLIGDGNLSIGKGKNAGGSFAHGESQKEYFFHKYELWKPAVGPWKFYEREDPRTEKVYRKYAGFLRCHPELTKLYQMLYPEGAKVVTPEYAKMMTPVSIAYWFMDDGSVKHIATNGFDLQSVLVLIECLKGFGIEGSLGCDNIITFRKAEFAKLFELISPHVIPSLMYKFGKLSQ